MKKEKAVPQKKPETTKKERLPSTKVETMFESSMIKRMIAYKKDHGFLKMQELIRVAVGNFLQKQGY